MLVVTIELWPHGIEEHRKSIASMAIANVSTPNLKDVSDYDIVTHELGRDDLRIKERKYRFQVKQHSRQQSVFALIAKAARKAAKASKPK